MLARGVRTVAGGAATATPGGPADFALNMCKMLMEERASLQQQKLSLMSKGRNLDSAASVTEPLQSSSKVGLSPVCLYLPASKSC